MSQSFIRLITRFNRAISASENVKVVPKFSLTASGFSSKTSKRFTPASAIASVARVKRSLSRSPSGVRTLSATMATNISGASSDNVLNTSADSSSNPSIAQNVSALLQNLSPGPYRASPIHGDVGPPKPCGSIGEGEILVTDGGVGRPHEELRNAADFVDSAADYLERVDIDSLDEEELEDADVEDVPELVELCRDTSDVLRKLAINVEVFVGEVEDE